MSKKIIIASIILALILLVGLSSTAHAFVNSSLASPRIIAMGGAYVGIADDANAVFLNPAGLGIQRDNEFIANYGSLLGDITQYSFAGSVGLGSYGNLGIGYDVIGVYGIQLTDSSGNSVGTGEWYNNNFAVSYGIQVYDRILLGVKGHMISVNGEGSNDVADIADANGHGYGMDLGILMTPFNNINLGLFIGDLYATKLERSSGISEEIPTSAVLGIAYQPIVDKVLLALDLRSENVKENSDIDISIGGEVNLIKNLKLRLGSIFVKNSDSSYTGSGSAGIGFSLFDNLRFDYARRRPNGMNFDSHYFSLGCKF